MIGILYALVPMIAWGSIGLASNKIGGDEKQQTLGMTLGAFVFALIVFLIVRPHMTLAIFVIGFIGGLLWSIGQFGQFKAMQNIGVSVAGPISSGGQLVLGGLIGALLFGEWTRSIQFVVGFIAFIVLLVGFYFSARRDKADGIVPEHHNFGRGITALIYSTLGYVLYVILFNNLAVDWFHIHFSTLTIIFPMSIGMILGALAMGGFKIKMEKYVFQNMSVGIMWGIGNVFMLMAAAVAGNAIAFAFSQLGIIISTIGGILFLGEKKTKKELRWVTIGIILFVVGALMLAYVKTQG